MNVLLQHTVATIAYRFQKAIRYSLPGFGDYRLTKATRTPNEIINHMCDLLNKTNSFITNNHFNTPSPAMLDLEGETDRLLTALQILEQTLATTEIDTISSKRLLQGPLSDIITHIGQLAMLNGLYGHKVPKEDYSAAAVSTQKLKE